MAPAGARDVLVVDDDTAIRRMLEIRLRRLGLTSDVAADGVDALDKISEAHYDVILVDLMMPRLDGAEFVSRLVEGEATFGDRPIVLLMTASADHDAIVPTRERIHAVIPKPFDLIKLGELVRDCVETRRAGRASSQSQQGGTATRSSRCREAAE